MGLLQRFVESLEGKAAFARGAFQTITEFVSYKPLNLWDGMFKVVFFGVVVLWLVENGILVVCLGDILVGKGWRATFQKFETWIMRILPIALVLMIGGLLSMKMMGMDVIEIYKEYPWFPWR